MKIKETFDITPDTSVMNILGSSGYSLETAIADIIDNSIYAQAHNIYVDFEFNGPNTIIKIIDDGIGMNLEKLKNACIIGYDYFNNKRESSDLGKFSTGLKSASKAVASKLIIQSVTDETNTVLLDFDNMNKVGWKCNLVELDEKYITSKTGTAIIWQKIKDTFLTKDNESFNKTIDSVVTHLQHTFNDFIKERTNIWINHSYKLDGWDPFCLNMDGTMIIEDTKKPYLNDEIAVKTYILPPYNNLNQNDKNYMKGNGLSEQQGFYIYRNKRLIYEGGWLNIEGFSISNKYDYARIRVDISSKLDDAFSTNYMKDKINIPEELKNFFRNIANKARTNSLKNFNFMKAPKLYNPVKKDKIPVWNTKMSNNGVILSINDKHPIIQNICKKLNDKEKKKLFDILSKNIPSSEISRSGMSYKQNECNDLKEWMEDMYLELKQEDITNDDICKKMMKCEPFCSNEENISILLEFLYEKKVL